MLSHARAALVAAALVTGTIPVHAQDFARARSPLSDATAPAASAPTRRDGGLLCVFDPTSSRKLRETQIVIDPATGDTFAVLRPSDRPLPLGLVYPPRRGYVTSRPWFGDNAPLTFAGRDYQKDGAVTVLPMAEMRPVGTTADIWLFEHTPAVTTDLLYAAAGPGCQFQPYRATVPAVRGGRATRGIPPRHRLLGYLTNRVPTTNLRPSERFGAEQGPLLEGAADVAISSRHRLGRIEKSGLFGWTDTMSHIVLVRLDPFPPQRSSPKALLYIHGYLNTFEDAAQRSAQLAEDLDFGGDVFFFSWPSRGRVLRYPADQASVRRSRADFKTVLDRLVQMYGPGNVSVLAHSLGTRGLGQAVEDLAASGRVFDQVVIASPDEDFMVFRDQWSGPILAASSRVTVYTSSRDRALGASQVLGGGPVAGRQAADFAQIQGIDVIDTSSFSGGWVGHSDYAESPPVLGDLYLLLRGRTPAQRGLVQIAAGNGSYWAFP